MNLEAFYLRHTKITRSLKKFISDQQVAFPAPSFESFLDLLSDELEKIKSLLLQLPAGPERAKKVHALVDHEVSLETEIPLSCTKGCSHCCHLEVEVTNYEAKILKDIVSNGFPIDLRRLKVQAERSLQDPAWRTLGLRAQNRCVFLGADESCEIYDTRPVMCRRHSVTSPAKYCESLDQLITLRYFPRVDLIISAANEDPELRIGPLAKMLSTELD